MSDASEAPAPFLRAHFVPDGWTMEDSEALKERLRSAQSEAEAFAIGWGLVAVQDFAEQDKAGREAVRIWRKSQEDET